MSGQIIQPGEFGPRDGDYEEIVVKVHPKHKAPRNVRLQGRWLVRNVPVGSTSTTSVAINEDGQLVSFWETSHASDFDVDDDFDEFVHSYSGGACGADDLLAAVAAALGHEHFIDV